MAVDQFFLQNASLDNWGGVLRFYDWNRPTLSFGYLQRVARKPATAAALAPCQQVVSGPRCR